MNVKPKLLLVDDEERFVKSLQNILTHYEYDCTIALSGSQAMNCLKQELFDIALLDVGLPNISGYTIAEFIKTSCQCTTVIMLTGLNTVETAVEAMKKGAYDFLSKPVDHEQLLKSINKALEYNSLKKELYVSEKRFETLADVAWEGIVLQEDGYLLEANKQFYNMFGYIEEELPRESFLERLLTPEAMKTAASYFNDSRSASFEILGVRKDGSRLDIEAKSCLTEYLGRPAQVLIFRDISDRIRHEREKLALHEKLANANKLKALGMMAGSVAHDLNNILTAIVSYPDLLLRQMEESDRHYKEIKKIQEAGKQAVAVVSDLVSIARGGVVQKMKTSNLNEIITKHLDSIEHSERLLKFPNIYVQTDLQQDLHYIECSPAHINKLLLNLIGNALESLKKHGVVRVSTMNCRMFPKNTSEKPTSSYSNYVKLVVSDSGPGIDPSIVNHIFNPFYTTKKNGASGTGLGLSIVWNIVKEHNGWIETENNQGATFEIFLPAADRILKQDSIMPDIEKGNGESILIVDDQEDQNIIMAKMLDILGYKTFAVTSGEQAIAYLRKNTAELVFLDMKMGEGLSGCQTYAEILKIVPFQKALIISGYSEMEEIRQAKKLGISIILEKPVSFQKISKAIRESLIRN